LLHAAAVGTYLYVHNMLHIALQKSSFYVFVLRNKVLSVVVDENLTLGRTHHLDQFVHL
jgi:hypothetical protein